MHMATITQADSSSSCTNRTRSPTRPLGLQLYISKLIGGGMALLNLDELEGARKVVERSELEVRRTPCILVRGDQACNILPDLKHVKGWNRCLGLFFPHCVEGFTSNWRTFKALAPSKSAELRTRCEFSRKRECNLFSLSESKMNWAKGSWLL